MSWAKYPALPLSTSLGPTSFEYDVFYDVFYDVRVMPDLVRMILWTQAIRIVFQNDDQELLYW